MFKSIIVSAFSAFIVLSAGAEDAQKVNPKVQEVIQVVTTADKQSDIELKLAQVKYAHKKIEARQLGIKAAEQRIRQAATGTDDRLLADLLQAKADLQAQVKELEDQLKADQPAQVNPVRKTLQTEVEAVLAKNDLKHALAMLQGTWRAQGVALVTIKGDQLTWDVDPCTLVIQDGHVHANAHNAKIPTKWNAPVMPKDNQLVFNGVTYSRGK